MTDTTITPGNSSGTGFEPVPNSPVEASATAISGADRHALEVSIARQIDVAQQALDLIRQSTAIAAVELSVVMPCLNEADTLATCIEKIQTVFREEQISGEIIVADNGSTDGSPDIARRMGARVVPVTARGYGNALMGGIEAARGKFVIMGDADDSYNFLEIPKFLEQLRAGHQLVQGCRLPAGGGNVLPGAMPWLHRWWGNPMFSWMVRNMFCAPIHDVYCGLRGFTRQLYDELRLQCVGMEFATEMIIKSSLFNKDIAEVPVTLHPDGRKAHAPHLRTFRDGWRTLRFFLMYSPRWLYLVPGMLLCLGGAFGYLLAMPGLKIGAASLDVHTLLFASLSLLTGYQLIHLALFAKTFAASVGLMPHDPRIARLGAAVASEKTMIVGAVALLAGLSVWGLSFNYWRALSFGPLNYSQTMRWVIPGFTLVALGFQTIASSFFLSILRMARRTTAGDVA